MKKIILSEFQLCSDDLANNYLFQVNNKNTKKGVKYV